MKILVSLMLCCITFCEAAIAQVQMSDTDAAACCTSSCRCNDIVAPAGIKTAHVHKKGEWMLAYDYSIQEYSGALDGRKKVGDMDVFNTYMMSPGTMAMQMHMAMVMYGITDNITVMAMGMFVQNDMAMHMMPMVYMPSMPNMPMSSGNMTMNSTSVGLGDAKLSCLMRVYNRKSTNIVLGLGVGLPTGSTVTSGTTMLGDNTRMPYSMQLGTGSTSIDPSITLVKTSGRVTLGTVASADIKVNKNAQGYQWGNWVNVTAWAGYKVSEYLSCNLRADGTVMGGLMGRDDNISVPVLYTVDPNAVPSNYGGKWCSVFVGLNAHLPYRFLDKFQLKTEYGLPVFQEVNGLQTALSFLFNASIQYKF
jgi:hypothetical protein